MNQAFIFTGLMTHKKEPLVPPIKDKKAYLHFAPKASSTASAAL